MSSRIGLVRCEFCQRQFNAHSAARHIPWCKKQQSESKRHRLSSDKLEALERYRWRISYKPSNSNVSSSGAGAGARSLQNFSKQQSQLLERLAVQRNHQQRSSLNSSATLSSPSASSTTSLSTSIGSNGAATGHLQAYTTTRRAHMGTAEKQPARRSNENEGPSLKRSVSSLTLTKQQGRISGGSNVASSELAGRASGEEARRTVAITKRQNQTRTKSVSDLSDMGELVEVLARRMEEICAQNKLLLESLIGSNKIERHCDKATSGAGETGELELCHHCNTSCPMEANYCHKCGCKMRPSNPTPSRLD